MTSTARMLRKALKLSMMVHLSKVIFTLEHMLKITFKIS